VIFLMKKEHSRHRPCVILINALVKILLALMHIMAISLA